MAELQVNFAGVNFRNPLVLASATPGWDGLRLKKAGEAGFGAVIPKTIGPIQDWAVHPRNGRLFLYRVGNRPVGMINLELFTTKTREEWIARDLALAREGGAKIFASILAMPEPEQTAELASQVEATGLVDLFELNVSCPMPASTVGMHIGKNPELTYRQVKAAKGAIKLPLSVKLTPNVADMVEIAQAAVEAGVDAITISNSIRSFAGVDIETGRPYLRGYGGYTGPAIKPIIMRHFSEVARAVKVPLSAVGGVSSWREVVEYIMLGATTVQIATTIMWEGLGKVQKILDGLSEFMDRKGYRTIEDFRGIALPYIKTVEELAQEPPRFATIDQERCNNCDICSRVCFYGAIRQEEGRTWADKASCDGCGLCVQWCPVGAIELKE
ncbi:dihydropyrimidine dehydrogenase (NAD+) subunit PreA [Thermanaeromonas toyohensis ToBE]|uniref:Dihydroorotate dehydrogenase B (NAD(+)), catalytic subunit n=1 Tax=Thermanaeromonas toyohensis ToBE TaxID=698762 RepID=A0A1W1VF01_9FIRM|nr:4Fe-4S binding protein [Thermanaeromonas toyohensis]SMB91866.1 dihydropyrimidine dehydrogenase (NAD+) subunit PreA [Thermanaeromonas toyohensis ToBE]